MHSKCALFKSLGPDFCFWSFLFSGTNLTKPGSVPFQNRSRQNMKRTLVVSLLILVAIPFWLGNILADSKSNKAGATVGSESLQKPSESRLFEAINSYMDGMRGTSRKYRAANVAGDAGQRRNPNLVLPIQDSGELREADFFREEAIARRRDQSSEWELAAISLERASQIASSIPDPKKVASTKEKLQENQSKVESAKKDNLLKNSELTNSVGMNLVVVSSGTFEMGSSSSEIRRIRSEWNIAESLLDAETPEHKVRITKPYLIGKYEVTTKQFRQFVTETGYKTVAETQGWAWAYDSDKKKWLKKNGMSWKNPGMKSWDDHPVTFMTHADAEAFCDWLSARDGRKYRLPTEAQWEYASRGGDSQKRFSWGDEYPDSSQINIADKSSPFPWADRTTNDGHPTISPVGFFQPNGFKLYDMAGNAWEICSDIYDPKAFKNRGDSTSFDPVGPKTGKKRVVRGGNWAFGPEIARNSFRFGLDSNLCVDICGFRVVADLKPDEYDKKSNTAQTSPETQLTDENVENLMSRVKQLSQAGKRREARILIDNLKSVKPDDAGAGCVKQPEAFVRNTLNALIDLTEDKSIQSFTNSYGMKMIRIPSGSFVMGSSEADIAWAMTVLAQGRPVNLENEYPFHKVRISRPFYMSETEVTTKQFRAFVEDTGYVTDAEEEKGGQIFNPTENRFEKKDGSSWRNPGWDISPNQPVTMVSYNDAQAFVEWLSAKEKLPYKLPTEAQWEYAARGRIPMAPFPWGDSLPDGDKANYADSNTDFEWRDRDADDGYKFVAPVGKYQPNGFGLYDISGNVLEWVRDYYGEDYYKFSPEIDPEGPGHGEFRVMKGGEWTFGPVNMRCAFRGWSRPDLAVYNGGFRVVIDYGQSLRPSFFAEDFLTKEWIPGPEYKEVAQALAKEDQRSAQTRAAKARKEPKPANPANEPVIMRGVLILDFSPKSDAKKAGLLKGDIIVSYDGVTDLSSDKLIALTSRSKKDKSRPEIIFIRDGKEYAIKAFPGFLGISVMDTSTKPPERAPESEQKTPSDKDKKNKGLNWT